jgi:hypothetical protein
MSGRLLLIYGLSVRLVIAASGMARFLGLAIRRAENAQGLRSRRASKSAVRENAGAPTP